MAGFSTAGRCDAERRFGMRAGPIGEKDDTTERAVGRAVRDQSAGTQRLVVGMGRQHKPARL